MLIFINHTESDLADVPKAHVITINSNFILGTLSGI